MALVETFWYSRLFSGDPLTITGPLWLPRNVDAIVRTSNPSCGELCPWQVKQYCVKTGRTSFSNVSGVCASAGTSGASSMTRSIGRRIEALRRLRRVRQDSTDNFRAGYGHVRRRFQPSAVRILDPLVIHAKLVKNGCGHIGNAYSIRHGFVSKVIGLTVDQAFLEPPSGKPDRKGVAVMIAAVTVLSHRK